MSRDNLGGMDGEEEEEWALGLLGCWVGLFPRGLWWGERAVSVRSADKSKKAGGGCPAEGSDVGISGADQNWLALGDT